MANRNQNEKQPSQKQLLIYHFVMNLKVLEYIITTNKD